MDVLFFLKERTKFIRRFYEQASGPFRETQRKIEENEPPFDDPFYSEDGEPPFLEEWIESETALEMLGRTCISMLSSSIQLYFKTWESELRITWKPGERNKVFKNGFIEGYRKCFGEVLELSWDDCPVNFEILEQITLARNRDQHPDHITTLRVAHTPSDQAKYKELFFVRDSERAMLSDHDMENISWINPSVHVSADMLIVAIEHVDMMGEWLEDKMLSAKYRYRR